MADYNLEAKITADASGYEAGIKKAQNASKNLSTTVSGVIKGLGKNGLVGALGAVGLASSGLSATLGTVVKVARQVSQAIGECTEAYKKQLIAERQLETAIQNNPFVTGASSRALKQFASEMQKVSNYGDEQLIPMMANLVSLGRSEEETMKIMSVALDMSANGSMSLDTAINQLNATLNGSIGRLGQQNAELKGLTEEELKSGKAIEILGEKFKGLAGATADTSTQLKNIKGDFKEAIGQFTLPSSDMWNKFWAGFYERGIEVLNKINAFMDAQTIGKKVAGLLVEQLKPLEYYGDRIRYLRDAMHTISEDELKALQNYLSNLSYISEDQKQILNFVEQEISRRKDLEQIESNNAKIKAESVKAQEKATAELEKQKQIEADMQKEREKQLELELGLSQEWSDKLLAQRIEILEKEREASRNNEEIMWEDKLEIDEQYADEILELRLEQIERAREEALKQENVTEETRAKINEYYDKKITSTKADEGEKRLKTKKGIDEEEKKEEEKKYFEMVQMVEKYTKKVEKTFKKIAKKIVSTVKSVLSGIGNVFTRIVEFNPDEALDNLLKFEDAVLTFFVETLPKLPAFFSSAVESIVHLITSLLDAIDFDDISNIIESIISSIGRLITSISEYININGERLAQGLSKLVSTFIKSISDWVASGGWKELLNAILTIQKAIEKVVMDNIDDLVNTIVAMLPDLVNTLIESIVSASQTLAKLIKPILKLIIALIKAFIEVALSDEVMDAMTEVLGALIEAIFDIFLNELPRILPKLITKMTMWIPKITTKITATLIKSIIKVLVNTNWGEVFYEIFMGIKESFEELGQGIMDIVSDLSREFAEIFSMIGQAVNKFWNWMVEGATYFFHGVGEGLWTFFTGVGENIKNFFQGIFDWLNNGWKWLVEGVSWVVNQIKDSFEWAFGGIKNFFDGIFQGIMWAIEQIKASISWISNGLSWFFGGPKSWFGWATGTNDAPKGLALVGEQGPELVKFNGGEQVLNTRNTQKLLADAGKRSGNTFNVTFNNLQDTTAFNMLQQLKQYNRQMAINGII